MAFFDDLKKSLTDVSETIAKKSGEVMEVQKLKLKKCTIESDIRKDYELLGRIYFNAMEESGAIDDSVLEIFQKIVEAKDAVAEIEKNLEKFSKSKKCPVCGGKSSKDTAFCPHCGTKFPAEETDEAAEESEPAEEPEATEEPETTEAPEITEEPETTEEPAAGEETGAAEETETSENSEN